MHIVIDCRCIQHQIGGIGMVAKQLLEQLSSDSRGHLITALLGPEAPDSLDIPAIGTCRVPGGMVDDRFEQIRLPDILAELKPDIYLNTTFAIPGIKTCPFHIAIIHDVVFEDRPDWVEPSLGYYLRHVSRFAARYADHIITVSEFSKVRIHAVYGTPLERISRIYNGLPLDGFELTDAETIAATRRTHQLTKPFVLTVSTMEIKKGIPELIAAFTTAIGLGLGTDLVLVGQSAGPAFDVQEAIRSSGYAHRIHYLGFVDHQTKMALLSACELMVYPSLYEGFGLPPLEGMALGIPCLVHHGTSLPEVVGDCALCVDVTDRTAFAQALVAGLSDAEFRERAKRTGPLRAQSFSRATLASQYLDVCESVLAAV